MRTWRPAAPVLLAALVLAGCDLRSDAPVVAPVGPTAVATRAPQADPAQQTDGYAEALDEIESLLAQADGEPIDTLEGTVGDSEDALVAEIMEIRSTELSIVLRIQLRPGDGQPLDLRDVDGGLSGELGEGNRTIADVALVDEAGERQVLPTVYRPDVNVEDPEQRCMCSSLPAVLPPEGVRVTAHYVRPEEGFRSVVVSIPGLGDSRPLAPSGG